MESKKRNSWFRLFLLALFIVTQILSIGYTGQADSDLASKDFLYSPDSPDLATPCQELRHDASAIIKLVPVRVLSPDGQPIRNLRKDDFVLFDNGQQQAITEFEIHEPPGLTTSVEPEVRADNILQDVNRKYFFVLDMQGSDRIGNKRAKSAVRAFSSSHLQPGDEVCLMTFGVFTGLVLRQYLTSDLDKITKAVEHSIEMASIVGTPQADVIEVPDYTADNQAGGQVQESQGGLRKPSETFFRPQSEESQASNRIVVPGLSMMGGRTYADFDMSMSELAAALSYIPGNKIVVYFSTRVPNQNVSRLFADASATIFVVNTNSVPAQGGGANGGVRRRQKAEQGHVLAAFAEASGGRYFEDAAAADTIAKEVAKIAGHYYVLGYYIHPAWEGRAHEIKVEVTTSGLRVLAQSGYNDPKPFAQWTDIEKQLHFFDLALSDGPVRVEALELPLKVLCRPSVSETNLAILTRLEIDDRTGLPPGRTEAYFLIFDGERQIVESRKGMISTESSKTRRLYPYMVMHLPPGPYECRVVFRDMNGGRSSACRQSFRIPERPASGKRPIICATPLLLGKTYGTFVRLGKDKKKKRPGDSLLSIYPFWPRDCFPLLGESRLAEISVLVPVLPSAGFSPEKGISIELEDDNGEKLAPVEWAIMDSRAGANKTVYSLLRIKTGGQTRLRIRVTVTDTLSKGQDSIVITQ